MTAALMAQFFRLRDVLKEATDVEGDVTVAEVLDEVLAGRAQLWPGDASVLVTQCVEHDGVRAIHAWLGGGILSELASMRPGVEAFGRAMGARFATIDGRPGWERFYRRYGYKLDDDGVLRKAL